ncbi:MAG TPA: immunoglobulin domain-containing protein [Holophaga sp.]|nr:immunoglobulin domain-containing protein [Holophaga sp.]
MNIRRVLAHPAFLLRATVRTVGLLAATLLTAFFLACSSGNDSGGTSVPTILAQPKGMYIQTGKPFALAVTTTGKPAPAYQWMKGGTSIQGATLPEYKVAAATAADSGAYTVRITNAQGSVTSEAATVTVLDLPVITADPVAVTTGAGMGATLQVTATGGAPLSYQWMRDGQAVSGATSATYAIAAAAPTNAGTYTVTVSNPVGVATSKAATITVVPPLVVTAPASAAVVDGGMVSFSVTPAGLAPYTFQWLKNGVAITGAQASTYAIPAALWATENGAQYACTVTDALNRTVTTAFATVTVTPIAPAVTADPADLALMAGEPATFTVGISGTLPIAYQWYNGSTPVAGATSNTLTLAAVTKADEGLYWVKATNAAGTVSTKYAKLSVNPLLSVSGPANQSVNDGATATFSVVATGVAPYTYQWYRGATLVTGAQSASYTTPATVWATDNGAQFTCKVSDSLARTVTSSAATLVVVPAAPAITSQPADKAVTAGTAATFSVTATGTAPLGYQWYLKGAAVTGATSSTWTLSSPAVADTGSVYVVVSNGAGQTVTSSTVTLTVTAPPSPTISVHPASKTVTAPDGATFSVTASGGSLNYQWYRNGSVITGATNPSYTVTATDLRATADVYTVDVTNAAGTTTSNAATLTVQAPIPVYAGDPLKPAALAASSWFVVPSWYLAAPADTVLGSFRVGYDVTHLNPLFSAACFFPSGQVSASTRPGTYPDDTRIAGSASSSDYTSTGWSRGHMTGFADLRDHYGTEAGNSTMYMSNMCPQDQPFNGGPWQLFEELATTTYPAAFGRVWVYTGPIFAEQIVAPIGAKNIPVPNAFYKIMVRETAPGAPKVLAAILPNSSTIGKPGVNMTSSDFWKFTTTVDRVQELTGLTFFPNPSSPLPVAFTSTVDVTGWGAPLEQGPSKPNVHMIQPSWDSEYKHTHNSSGAVTIIDKTTGMVGDVLTFKALAIPGTYPIATTTWTFGDGGTASTINATHAYAGPGDFTVTFTATDSNGATNSISRVVTIGGTGNTAPVLAPSTLPGVSITLPTATATQVFSVTDDSTASSAITFTFGSDNTAIIDPSNASQISAAFDSGTSKWTVTMNPVTASISATTVVNITVNAFDGAGASTTKTFALTINPAAAPGGTPKLIISQYYEGTSNNKWIEITNVGNGTYDSAAGTVYLCYWNNPRTTNAHYGLALTGTLAPGASLLVRNANAVLPATSYNGGATTTTNGSRIISTTSSVMNFNGNDVVYLSNSTPATTTDTAPYVARFDVIGNYTVATDQTIFNWDPATPVVIPTGWGFATPPGQDRSYVRLSAIVNPNGTYTPSEWAQVDAVQITASALGLCSTAATTDTNFLGFHDYVGRPN